MSEIRVSEILLPSGDVTPWTREHSPGAAGRVHRHPDTIKRRTAVRHVIIVALSAAAGHWRLKCIKFKLIYV